MKNVEDEKQNVVKSKTRSSRRKYGMERGNVFVASVYMQPTCSWSLGPVKGLQQPPQVCHVKHKRIKSER